MDRKGSGILGHPITGVALRADPAAGGDGLLWSDASKRLEASSWWVEKLSPI
jgi:hypothetical protein